jgi:hypothetical protein
MSVAVGRTERNVHWCWSKKYETHVTCFICWKHCCNSGNWGHCWNIMKSPTIWCMVGLLSFALNHTLQPLIHCFCCVIVSTVLAFCECMESYALFHKPRYVSSFCLFRALPTRSYQNVWQLHKLLDVTWSWLKEAEVRRGKSCSSHRHSCTCDGVLSFLFVSLWVSFCY